MGKRRQSQDLLSDLPVSLIENILVFLSIRDAIRTSVLSTKWRIRWTTLPRLVFDEDFMGIDDENEDFGVEYQKCLKTFVTRTLLRHEGPLHMFTLVANIESCHETHQWLLFLLKKDIKELILRLNECFTSTDFHVPSCLFSFQNLTFLEISRCEFGPPPPNFKGFLCLRTLILEELDVPAVTIQSIVAHSPLLENLQWIGFLRLESELIISAPKLKNISLVFYNHYGRNVYFFAPLLINMSLSVRMSRLEHGFYGFEKPKATNPCYYTKFLGGFANLETLAGDGSLTKYLSLGFEHYQSQHPLVFHCLKAITLGEVSCNSMDEMLVAVRLIMDASTTLCELQLRISDYEEKDEPKILSAHFWDSIYPRNFTFGKLKFVKVENFRGGIQEMKFIKFLLASSPVLERMKVESAFKEILSYHRASTNATILF